MAYQTVFKRYEIKYVITEEQKEKILEAMAPYMVMDKYGESTIRNIYFDTDDYILARHSIAKPDFKEKLRIRSYTRVGKKDNVFVELKRKYDHVVYKRRVALPEEAAMNWTTGGRMSDTLTGATGGRMSDTLTGATGSTGDCEPSVNEQMTNEINYFLDYYKDLHPAVFLSYDREAYRMKKQDETHYGSTMDKEFRVTFDSNVLARNCDISLESEVYGTPVLEPGKILMELKCTGGVPVWMAQVLSEEKIYKTSFSKYGTAYTDMILPEIRRQTEARKPVTAVERSASDAVPGSRKLAAGFRREMTLTNAAS